MTVTEADIRSRLDADAEDVATSLELVPIGGALPGLPSPWAPILASDTAKERVALALVLWNTDFLDLLPGFHRVVREQLKDVRVGHRAGRAILIYAVEIQRADRRIVPLWFGYPPVGEDELVLLAAAPLPFRTFLSTVHGGFVAPDEQSFGPMRPRDMRTIADLYGEEAVDDWPDDGPPSPDGHTMLMIARTHSRFALCVSPELPGGQAAMVYQDDEPDPPNDFWSLLDLLLQQRFEVEELL